MASFIQMPCQIVRGGRRVDLPVAVVEPLARGLPPDWSSGCTQCLAMLNSKITLEVGVRIAPDPYRPSSDKKGEL